MSASDQQRLLDPETDRGGARVEIETSGRVIRPALSALTFLVDECRIHADEEGLYVAVVDPANVAMSELRIHPRAFEAYELAGGDSTAVGMDLEIAEDRLSHARLGTSTDDPVSLTLDATTSVCEVTREYGGTEVTRHDEWLNIDTDSIREDADPPDLALSYEAGLAPEALEAAVQAADRVSDHARIREVDGAVSVEAGVTDSDKTVTEATRATIGGDVELQDDGDAGASSVFSLDYLTDITSALVETKVDEVSIRWGQEFPLLAEYERLNDEGEPIYEGTIMLAPRITSGGDGA